MKLTCPKCRAKSTVPDERVPAAGAWARCPGCGERFFVRHLGQAAGLDSRPQQAPAKSTRGRSEEAQKMINRLRAKTEAEAFTSLDGPAYNPEIITVFPQPMSNDIGTFLAIGILAALVGFVLIGSFQKGSTVKVASPEPTRIIDVPAYGEKELRTDFLLFRKLTTDRPHLRREVNYTGYESRVVKYFLRELAPDECQEITSLYIKADRVSNGFTATAVCLDPGRGIPDMHVRWEGRDAVIMFEGRDERRKFTLFPLEGQPAADGRTAYREEIILAEEFVAN